MSEWLTGIENIHLLRPWWLLGVVPAAIALGLYQWRKRSAGNWEQVINPALLPYLMQGDNNDQSSNSKRNLFALGLAWLLCCVALAGPTWQQLPQPVHKQDSALVLVFDLSPSMLAEDIAPSRLVRARYKLIDILKKRREGFSALVVYGGEAHTVSPLTEDSNTIISLVPILHPTLLPEYGSNTEDAIETAINLASNSGYNRADLLLITDGVASSALNTVQSMVASAGEFRLSILGVGTKQGAPIPLGDGGFVKDRSGAILVPKLDSTSLQRLATNSGGQYRKISADDSDINGLLEARETLFTETTRELDRSFDLWDDQGFWIILLLVPLLILCFRRDAIAIILIAPLYGLSNPADASLWQDLWQTPDQQGAQALEAGDASGAQMLFEDTQWRGSAAYKAGDFESAINEFAASDSADSHYNRGNALARTGNLDDAVNAYNRALELNPEMEDALANRDLIEQLKKQQEQQSEQNSQDQQQSKQDQSEQGQQQPETGEQSQSEQEPQPGEEPQPNEEPQPGEEPQPNGEPQSNEEPQPGEEPQPNEEPGDREQSIAQQQAQESAEQDKSGERQEIEQILRRVPDDPGGLLRQKFRHQSQQRALEQRRPKPPNEQERW